jgi:DNA-binding MarR family transcriptional regulator
VNYKMETFLAAMSPEPAPSTGLASASAANPGPTLATDPAPTFQRSLPALLLVGHLEMRRLLEQRLEATGLNALEAVVIRTLLINRNPSIGDLREALALPASTATHVIDRLCDRGCVRRETGFDRRVVFVRLSGVGAEVARMVRETITALDREVYATADAQPRHLTSVVDAIELLASRERRLAIRGR